jgi:hypothetical protein
MYMNFEKEHGMQFIWYTYMKVSWKGKMFWKNRCDLNWHSDTVSSQLLVYFSYFMKESEKLRIDFPHVFMTCIGIQKSLPSSSRTIALRSTQPLTEMSTRNLPGGKGWLARGADNLTAICEPIVYKMWEPWHLTTLWAFMACYRDSFTFTLPLYMIVAQKTTGSLTR